jgi:hypothetical protein
MEGIPMATKEEVLEAPGSFEIIIGLATRALIAELAASDPTLKDRLASRLNGAKTGLLATDTGEGVLYEAAINMIQSA